MLDALRKAERLSESFHESLLTWRHGGGFSACGRHLILNAEPFAGLRGSAAGAGSGGAGDRPARLAHMARYAARGPVAADRVFMTPDGKVLLSLPEGHDPGGALVLDPLEWIRGPAHEKNFFGKRFGMPPLRRPHENSLRDSPAQGHPEDS